MGGWDFIEVWQLRRISQCPVGRRSPSRRLPVSEFDSEFCGGSDRCIPQPGAATGSTRFARWSCGGPSTAISARTRPWWGPSSSTSSGADQAGIRWFELHRVGSGRGAVQEGTYAPDTHSRWMGSIAMDGSGNMALGFSISSATMFPGMRYTAAPGSRPGVMDAEATSSWRLGRSRSATRSAGATTLDERRPGRRLHVLVHQRVLAAGGLWQTSITRSATTRRPAGRGAPICGDNASEVGEDCDGVDATRARGLWSDCTCPAPACGKARRGRRRMRRRQPGGCATGLQRRLHVQLCGAMPPSAGCLQPPDNGLDPGRSTTPKDTRIAWNGRGPRAGPRRPRTSATPPPGSGPAYAVCVYDASASPPAPAEPGRRERGRLRRQALLEVGRRGGYRYSNRDANGDGVTSLQLKAGIDGKSLGSASRARLFAAHRTQPRADAAGRGAAHRRRRLEHPLLADHVQRPPAPTTTRASRPRGRER